MTRGWYMPVESRRFHFFEGEGKKIRSLCGKFWVFASEILGGGVGEGNVDVVIDKYHCPACVKVFTGRGGADAG
jgi:hypothetical protein